MFMNIPNCQFSYSACHVNNFAYYWAYLVHIHFMFDYFYMINTPYSPCEMFLVAVPGAAGISESS